MAAGDVIDVTALWSVLGLRRSAIGWGVGCALGLLADEPHLEVRSTNGPLKVGIAGLVANTVIQVLPVSQALIWLHYGCESHGWVDGPDRGWLADRYQDALDAGLAREGMGWDKVIALLRERDDMPVVTSAYSDFPDFGLVADSTVWDQAAALTSGTDPDEEYERVLALWEDLDRRQQWELGMQALRKTDGGELQ